MFRFIWTLSVRTRDYLHRYMPSNRLLAAIRTRRGLKWGIPAMLVALPYILIASICSSSAADGGPGWLGNDTLIWPHRDGLIWPRPRHSGAVVTV